MEKKSFKERLKSVPVKRKIVALLIIVVITAIPVSAVAYQLNHKKPTKTANKSSKNGTSKNASNTSSKDGNKQGEPAGNNSLGSARATQSRLDRFNKDTIAKRIEQAQKSKRITDAQAKLLNKKLNDIEKFVKSNKSKNSQDLIKAISDKRRELQKWAEDNNIPTRYVAGWL